jgi:hypothetical protein
MSSRRRQGVSSRRCETINTELILADLQTVDKALPRLQKESRIKKDRLPVYAAAEQARDILDGGHTLFQAGFDTTELRELTLLTDKPFLYVFNLDSAALGDTAVREQLATLVAPAEAIFLDAQLESELT